MLCFGFKILGWLLREKYHPSLLPAVTTSQFPYSLVKSEDIFSEKLLISLTALMTCQGDFKWGFLVVNHQKGRHFALSNVFIPGMTLWQG